MRMWEGKPSRWIAIGIREMGQLQCGFSVERRLSHQSTALTRHDDEEKREARKGMQMSIDC